MLLEVRDRDEYLSGNVVYYFDHDVLLKMPPSTKLNISYWKIYRRRKEHF